MSSRGGGGGGRGGKVGGGGGAAAAGGGGGGGGGDFGRAVARAAVARMLEAAGFACAHRSAVDALVDVLLRYICQLGRAATFHANLAGRAAPNECDVIQFLEECGAAYYGFAGAASSSARCLANSAVVKDMVMFVSNSPFGAGRPLPRFPVQRAPMQPMSSFAALGRESGMSHVPEWLPAFPEPHTYLRTELWSEEVPKAGADEVERARQRRKAEKSLLSLQRRLAVAGADGFRPAMLVDGAVKANELDVVESNKANPFLERALPYGEKVSEVSMPGVGTKFSVIEAFAPAFEESKGGQPDEGMDQDQDQSQKRVVPKERPPVYFRIGIDKKSMVMSLNSRALGDQKDPWFLKEEKEQRAELILREAMENPHQLTQL
uniref:Transcription initiation factor TFIID subunit 8 n=1 Tax=Leersia perrieri TaxID=77586 RepID=A0A0D9VW73_9ORYZ